MDGSLPEGYLQTLYDIYLSAALFGGIIGIALIIEKMMKNRTKRLRDRHRKKK